ncbi:MAG TPA: PAS domain-containing sensor histidine kinase [Ohtaekwangia sp.]|nr:PAS domain-containing sensor histidine kinase [Ohtaekwangia sp.]
MSGTEKFNLQITSNDTFREIFQGSAEGIIMVNREGIIMLANPVSEQMFGYGEGELIGQSLENLLPERFRGGHSHLRENFNKHPAPRRMGVGRDLMAMKKDGSEFPVEVSLSYKQFKDDFFVVAFIIDITERKRAEEALKSSEEQLLIYAAELERKVQARTEALNKSVHELEKEVEVRKKAEEEARIALIKERELNELKSKFVSIASHEFRTPLSTIMSSASLVSQYLQKGDFEKIDKHTARIKSNVNHLTAILNDFLSLGKLEEGRIEINPETFVLDEFLKEIQEELKASLKDGQEIILECVPQNQTITTDARIIRNSLFNLLSNAIKYSDANKKIYLSSSTDNGNVTIKVRDEGIGIPEDDKRHMFDRFFRASNATNIQGTGLGLNIVKRYIELLEGTISFESEYGKGSTFTITFPA